MHDAPTMNRPWMRDLSGLSLAALFVGACARPLPQRAVPCVVPAVIDASTDVATAPDAVTERDAASDVASSDAAVDTAPASPLCARLQGEAAERVAPLRAAVQALFGAESQAPERLAAFSWCVPSSEHGAWMLSLSHARLVDSGESYEPWALTGEWTLAHVDDQGHRVEVAPSVTICGAENVGGVHRYQLHSERGGGESTRIDPPTAYDFDGDGVKELYLQVATTYEGDLVASWGSICGQVFTLRDRRVQRYAPAGTRRLSGIDDADGDGRPDLRTSEPYLGYLHYGDTPPPVNDERGPALVLHALPDGRFAFDDVTRRIARADCAHDAAESPYFSLYRVACQRMAGRAPAAVVADVVRECGTGGTGDFCNSLPEVRRWAQMTPPVTWSAAH